MISRRQSVDYEYRMHLYSKIIQNPNYQMGKQPPWIIEWFLLPEGVSANDDKYKVVITSKKQLETFKNNISENQFNNLSEYLT